MTLASVLIEIVETALSFGLEARKRRRLEVTTFHFHSLDLSMKSS